MFDYISIYNFSSKAMNLRYQKKLKLKETAI